MLHVWHINFSIAQNAYLTYTLFIVLGSQFTILKLMCQTAGIKKSWFQCILVCLGLIMIKNGPIQHDWRPLLRVSNGPVQPPQSHCVPNFILEGFCCDNLADRSKKCPKIPQLKIRNFSTLFLGGTSYSFSDELRVPRRAPDI